MRAAAGCIDGIHDFSMNRYASVFGRPENHAHKESKRKLPRWRRFWGSVTCCATHSANGSSAQATAFPTTSSQREATFVVTGKRFMILRRKSCITGKFVTGA